MKITISSSSLHGIIKLFKSSKEKEVIHLTLSQRDAQHIGMKSFVDLADTFHRKLHMPKPLDSNHIEFIFEKLHEHNSFHLDEDSTEKYGVKSRFFQIDKTAQFSFLYYYEQALWHVEVQNKKRILDLGVNKGDELKVIKRVVGDDIFSTQELVGIDYSASAIEHAKTNFTYAKNVSFYTHDINSLDELNLGRFDLLISIGTLQSSSENFNKSFMELYQNHVAEDGAIILGFPNCRWIDGTMVYGAKAKNYSHSEMGVVLKDIHFCKKYLQQKKYRVRIYGKEYLFLVATKIL